MSFQFIFTIVTIIVFTYKTEASSPPVVLWHGMGKKIIIICCKIVLKYRYCILLG